jgi:hypothetical protein
LDLSRSSSRFERLAGTLFALADSPAFQQSAVLSNDPVVRLFHRELERVATGCLTTRPSPQRCATYLDELIAIIPHALEPLRRPLEHARLAFLN